MSNIYKNSPITITRKRHIRIKQEPTKKKKRKRKRKRKRKHRRKTNKKLKESTATGNNYISYSPSINRRLLSLKSLSPTGAQGCNKDDIYTEDVSFKRHCHKWDSEQARVIMLRNLVSKKPIDCNAVTAPKQLLSNCWFNSFFMTFFISDKGRKFNRWLREAMITGVMANKEPVPIKLRRPLFLLNKYIDASLRAPYNKKDFASLMNTNNIIKDIHAAIGGEVNIDYTLVAKVDVPSNPFSFYSGLYNYLGFDLMHWSKIVIQRGNVDEHWLGYKVAWQAIQDGTYEQPKIPKVVFLEIFDQESMEFNKPVDFFAFSTKNGEKTRYKYTLDSAILRNTEQFHFSAYLTCNGKEFSFDGESFSRMKPFKWKSKLNKNTAWKTSKENIEFNFQKGYQLLVYYIDQVE
tara:strand:- start:1292 stop:2506 length:1215 start_codon:yes stop_codon:yes gene_type:complete